MGLPVPPQRMGKRCQKLPGPHNQAGMNRDMSGSATAATEVTLTVTGDFGLQFG